LFRARKLHAQIGACPVYRTLRFLCQTVSLIKNILSVPTDNASPPLGGGSIK
jgi:hypothetical protein